MIGRRSLTAFLIASLVGAAPACASMRVAVSPRVGSPTTRFVVAFTAPVAVSLIRTIGRFRLSVR